MADNPTAYQPEILYFGPSDASRTPIANYSTAYTSALSERRGVQLLRPLHLQTPEHLDHYLSAPSLVKRHVQANLRDQSRRSGSPERYPHQIIHGEIGPTTFREFWGVYWAARMRPEVPVVLVFHDPPKLTPPIRKPQGRGKGNFLSRVAANLMPLDRIIDRFTENLSDIGQKNVEEFFLDRSSVFLAHTRQGAELLAERFPEFRYRVGQLPPVMLGPVPHDLEPKTRDSTEPVQITVFGFIQPDRALDEIVDAMAILHKRSAMIGKVVVRIRGRVPNWVLQSGYVDSIQDRIKRLDLNWMISLRPGAMRERDIDKLLRDTDILVIPHRHNASCMGASMTMLRSAAWNVALVASEVGAISEQLSEGKDCLTYTAGNINQLADRIDTLIQQQDFRLQLAMALRERILGNSPRRISRKVVDLYQEVLSARDEKRLVEFPREMRVFELPPPPPPPQREESPPPEADQEEESPAGAGHE